MYSWRRRWAIALAVAMVVAWPPIRTPVHAAAPSRHERAFWVLSITGWRHVPCRELAFTAHAQVWAALHGGVSTSEAVALASLYETHIYPTDTALFGTAAGLTPVDIVLAPLDSMTLGYFNQNDLTPRSLGGDPAHSNRANVLYVRLPSQMPDSNRMADVGEVVAHELQHLIEFRLRVMQRHQPAQQDWLNEGLSFYAQIANGFWTPRDVLKVQAAAATPQWPVTQLSAATLYDRHDARVAYGRAGLFVSYLATRFGPALVHGLVGGKQTGMSAVVDALNATRHHPTVASVFTDWGVAEYLGRHVHTSYGPYSRELNSTPRTAVDVGSYPYDSANVGVRLSLRPWGQSFLRFSTRGRGNLRVDLTGAPGALRAATVLEDSDGVVTPAVRPVVWRSDGTASVRVAAFGTLYDRMTIVLGAVPSDVMGGARPTSVRVRARLVDSGNDDGTLGTAAPTGRDLGSAAREVLNIQQPVALRGANPEAP